MVQNDKEGTYCVNPAIRGLSNDAQPNPAPGDALLEDTEHYRVTRDFLANPSRMWRILMGEE